MKMEKIQLSDLRAASKPYICWLKIDRELAINLGWHFYYNHNGLVTIYCDCNERLTIKFLHMFKQISSYTYRSGIAFNRINLNDNLNINKFFDYCYNNDRLFIVNKGG
jgi:hypothetical protein